VADVNAEHRARNPAYPPTDADHAPTAVADVTVEPPAAGVIAAATQVVPSTVTSNVIVALNVPVICTATSIDEPNPTTVAACCAAVIGCVLL
jgi:hypothetical protein